MRKRPGDPAGTLKSKHKNRLGRRSYSPSTLPPSIPPDPVTVAWSSYADAVIAFNTARTGANARAQAQCYREFVSLFVGRDDDAGVLLKAEVVDIGEVRPGGAP